jgi:hypothetical protein
MMTSIGSAAMAAAPVPLVSFTGEALMMYGLVALLIGLIAWSKLSEPALSDPHAVRKPTPEPMMTSRGELGPAVAVPVVGRSAPDRERP